MATPVGKPQSFSPAAPDQPRRARSNVPLAARRRPEEPRWLDPIDLQPTGGTRWLVPYGPEISVKARREVKRFLEMKHLENDFSGWQMPFPFDLPCGEANPICALGECGDVNCPSYRPKHPEVRQAVEDAVLKHAQCFAESGKGIGTYVSVGAGLLAQDWIIIEKLRAAAAELRPSRVVVVDLRTVEPVIACEGRKFSAEEGGLDLCQLGYSSESLGPEFSFSALITFEGSECSGSRLFDFCNGIEEDNIYAEVVSSFDGMSDSNGLIFGVRRGTEEAQVAGAGAWVPQQPHLYLFTVSATGMMRIYIDGQLAVSRQGHPPTQCSRKRLYVGQSSNSQVLFCGEMRKIQVWNHCVDSGNVDGLYRDESARALKQFARWFAKDLSVYSFGTLAAYAQAAAEDARFQADLLLQIDVHEEIDGYDEVAQKVLGPEGVALTLAGPGRSWKRQGAKVVELEVGSEILSKLESRKRNCPWVFYGPGKCGRDHFCLEESRYLRLSGWAPRLNLAKRRQKAT